jgi:hypothetical protein
MLGLMPAVSGFSLFIYFHYENTIPDLLANVKRRRDDPGFPPKHEKSLP